MAAADVRHNIFKTFQSNGIFLDKEALAILSEYCLSVGGAQTTILQLIEGYQADGRIKITRLEATELVDRLCGGGREVDFIQVINAFEFPRIKFDPIRKAFYRDENPYTLFADATDKRSIYLERLYVLQQRLARNPLFNRPVFGNLAKRNFVELTEIKALLGSVGETKTVMGFISQLEDGHYFVEDLSGALKIDLSDTMTAAGFYLENCIVAAEGHLVHNGIFKVSALGMPPNERREDSLASAKGLKFFGGQELEGDDYIRALEWEADHPDDRIVFVSDIWLDKPVHVTQLETILSGFESLAEVPSLFVLMGNFHSFACTSPSTDYAAIKTNFASLAAMLSQHTRILESSKIVFVPGSGDPGPAAVFPLPPLPVILTQELRRLPNIVFATNPVRLRYYSQEIIVFRDDMQKRMRQLCLRPPVEGHNSTRSDLGAADAMFEHLAMTVTQQAHLCPAPLSNQAVYWQLDHALRINPLPHALVLADSAPAADYIEKKSGCVCINPGPLKIGSFAAYNPFSREAELCDVPELTD